MFNRGTRGRGTLMRYDRAFHRAQTMDQLRDQRPLIGREGPYRQYLPMPGCGNSTVVTACRLEVFAAWVKARRLTY